ncbi:hypothetical protein SESBI_07172 [Sesbania bispinosa]|nr:hypothetical protein SESBI_07172 [Sesbania bispinosa]
MDQTGGIRFKTGFEDVGVDEVVGARVCGGGEHVAEEGEGGRVVIGARSVSSDDGGEEVDVRGMEVVEDEASIGKVGKGEGAKANKLEGVEVGLGVTESDEVCLELLKVVEVIALAQYR